jgi:hypothetical protein
MSQVTSLNCWCSLLIRPVRETVPGVLQPSLLHETWLHDCISAPVKPTYLKPAGYINFQIFELPLYLDVRVWDGNKGSEDYS